MSTTPYINMHIMGSVLHYGQCLFEGLKAGHKALILG